MELNRFVLSSVWAIGLMIFIGVLTIALFFIGGHSTSDINRLWENGSLMSIYMACYELMLFLLVGLMWSNQTKTEYVVIPFIPLVALVITDEHPWPVSLALPMMLCYLIGTVYWFKQEPEQTHASYE